MCGIVGYVGSRNCTDVLINGLTKLEYRGYDSAGIAVFSESGNIQVAKSKGRLADLIHKMEQEGRPEGHAGIGHTRWATHGEPSDINSHPHTGGRVTIVHNGIIENYKELKEYLSAKGVTFASDTDTEVVARLLDYNYNGSPIETISNTIRDLEGSYALGIIFADHPDVVYATRKESPLIVGLGKEESFIASDVPAILRYTRDYYLLEQEEIAVLDHSGVKVYDAYGVEVQKERKTADWDMDAAEKGGYAHFMLKEIHEQPTAIKTTITPRIRNGLPNLEECNITPEALKQYHRIFVVACGTAMHAGVVGQYVIEKLARIPVTVDIASEFRYRDPILSAEDLVIIISQSGETADSLAALRAAKEHGAKTLAIVNVVGSSIAREADDVLYTWAGPEIAVATTKAYSTQLVLMDLIALYLGDLLGTIEKTEYDTILHELEVLPEKLERVLASIEDVKYFASRYFNHDSIFFIGRNLDYAMGLEGSLKLKEISYIHSEAYASGELKHGTISLIEEGTPVIALSTYGPLFDKAMSNVVEVQARGARVLALTTETHREAMLARTDRVLTVPEVEPMLLPQLGVAPLQLLAYYIALERGCDIDKPRNLAKSVTVE